MKTPLLIPAREKDLGGFSIRRILPYAKRRMVGPFIFLDHMGPVSFSPGSGMNVRPHPHINLATVTFLFEGEIHHRDSLGYDQVIEPGAVNWMVAGKGIVHSERTTEKSLASGYKLDGIQLWVAMPEESEEIEASFHHHPKETLPEFKVENVFCRLILGRSMNYESPVKVHSDLFYLEVKMKAGDTFRFDSENREMAAYVVDGSVNIEDTKVAASVMYVAPENINHFNIHASEDSHIMLLGGAPIGPRHIYWNFVSSSADRIEEAKKEWEGGPSLSKERFKPIPGDDKEFIPL